MRDVLVTGGSGQVGGALAAMGEVEGFRFVAPCRDELDLLSPTSFAAFLASRPWAAIINAAAYTAVDKAESEVEEAWRINALAPAVLAREAARAGVPLVHVSTDYVFNGASARPYMEDDAVAPLGVYGASKAAGEQGVRTGGGRFAIVRTSWVVSAQRANFLKTMLRLGAERDVLRVVADQQGAPTSARDLAGALARVARALACDPVAPSGTFHFANAGATTWADFAAEIFRLSAQRGGPSARVEPITTADYPTPARRPACSLLSTGRIQTLYGVTPRPWQTAIRDIIDELIPSRTT
jgi:dTDP-4-dehydrorhamnose reductase